MSEERQKKHFVELGLLLKETRIKIGYSQTQLGEAIGLKGPQFISNCERGLCKPTPRYLGFITKSGIVPRARVVELFLKSERLRLNREIDKYS